MKEIKAFKCEFCSKLYQVKGTCKRHELYCKNNPVNKFPCLGSCTHLEVAYYTDTDFVKCKTFYCHKHDKFMKTHVALRRNIAVDLPLMPIKCAEYEYEF